MAKSTNGKHVKESNILGKDIVQTRQILLGYLKIHSLSAHQMIRR